MALALLILAPWACSNALSQEDAASRIQAKIAQVGAVATKLHESGGDVAPIQKAMQQVDALLKSGDVPDAEKILDGLLGNNSTPPPPAASPVAPADQQACNPGQPMTVSGPVTITEDCTVGGDLTVKGGGVLHFDYSEGRGGRVVVVGNVVVQNNATLWVQGRPEARAVFVVDNQFSEQHSISSTDDAKIRLDNVEFRTHKNGERDKGSVYMNYKARGRSSFEATGSKLVVEECWLLANLHDSAKLTISDTQQVPTEIYVNDSSSAKLKGRSTRAGIWLDGAGATGTLKLPDVSAPFSWRVGAGAGLNVGWSFEVDDAQPGIGMEIKPTSALTIAGAGARAPATGELKISYFVIGSTETLDGLKAGLQNRKISDRLTLNDVQLGPIAWQIYAGDNADLTIANSTINEIGIFGRDAKVRVEHSLLQLAVLAAIGPGSSLDIRDSEIWNQSIEAANRAKVSITDSQIYGSLFRARDKSASFSIRGGAFRENPAVCSRASMVDIATGQPRCNPFRTPGMPRSAGDGAFACSGVEGCAWGH